MQRVPAFDYAESLARIEDDVMGAIRRVLHSGRLIMGPETEGFEAEFADAVGASYCVGVNSGTTALQLALMAIGISANDEVILPTNTCAPSAAAIRLCGGIPVFVEVNDDDLLMSPQNVADAISSKTRCILAVHLWGDAADLTALQAIAENAGIHIVEDCAQAMGTRFGGAHVGTQTTAGCFSFYPTKNLGAYGDAGALITNDPHLADAVRALRTYGYDAHGVAQTDGLNGRISEIQAAVLREKLRTFPESLARRVHVANMYMGRLTDPEVRPLQTRGDTTHSYHQFVVRCHNRQLIQKRLDDRGIGWGIHYPVPLHVMPAYAPFVQRGAEYPVAERAAQEILSIPIYDGLAQADVELVLAALGVDTAC